MERTEILDDNKLANLIWYIRLIYVTKKRMLEIL